MSHLQIKATTSLSEQSQDRLQRIRHDLQGPVINIEGFLGELQEAAAHLIELLQTHVTALPSEISDHATELLKNDVMPCIGFIDKSVTELNQRIDQFTQEFGEVLANNLPNDQPGERKC